MNKDTQLIWEARAHGKSDRPGRSRWAKSGRSERQRDFDREVNKNPWTELERKKQHEEKKKGKREALFSARNIGTAAGVVAGSFFGPVGLAAGGIIGRIVAGATADTILGTPEDLEKVVTEFKEGIPTRTAN